MVLPWEKSAVRPRKWGWHMWRGPTGMLYFRLTGTSPPVVVRIAPVALVLAVAALRKQARESKNANVCT